jgi:nucleotide sugar dehydrogenase
MGSLAIDLVVVGLGYVGLPLACRASEAGLTVAGLDTDPRVVARLATGRSPLHHVTHDQVGRLLADGFAATTDPALLAEATAIAVCVPTGLTPDGAPDLGPLTSACRTIAEHVHEGALVVIESTVYPGATETLVRPLLEARGLVVGSALSLGYSPERVDPGNPRFTIANTPKIVSGCTEPCAQRCAALYERFVDRVVVAAGTREAELAKLLENTYRHVNIALVNEMAVFSHELGVDLWDAIRCAATKPFGFQAFYPGPGVGGHCIPIDPNYLSYKVRTLGYPFRFVELAQEINSRMPAYVVDRAAELLNSRAKPLNGAAVLLVGVTYKRDIADQRESPVQPIARKLLARGARLAYHDPFVADWAVDGRPVRRVTDLAAGLSGFDLVLLLQDHTACDLDAIARGPVPVLDTRGRIGQPYAEML